MNKPIIIILVGGAMLALFSCTKSSKSSTSTSNTPACTFNITFNGKTYNITGSANLTGSSTTTIGATTTSQPTLVYTYSGSNPINAGYGTTINIGSPQVFVFFSGIKLDASTAIGTYKTGEYVNPTGWSVDYGNPTLTDYNDGGKKYSSDGCGHDTTGTITITTSNSTEIAGTFNLILTYNGTYYPATGSFDYKH